MLRLALSLLLLVATGVASAPDKSIEVFYLSTPDCPYCAHWESQTRPGFLASPEGRAAKFVEIRGETLRRPIEARHYPPEYQWVYRQLGPSRGVPRFVLAVDGRVVLSAYGTGGFETELLPALRAVLASRSMESA